MTATLPERPQLSDLGEAAAAAALHPGAALLDDVAAFLARFVAYPSEHAKVAHTLWIMHTHLMDAWESTPRIAFLSPEPGSGKTRAGVEVPELLVPNPIEAVNVTPAYLFRKIGQCAPTILYDEIDTVFGPKAKDNEEIRGLLNAGHRRGAVAGRCVVRGKIVETEEIPAYCAVALIGLGGLPDTLLSRSVVIQMRRRAQHEHVEEFRRRQHATEGHALAGRLAEWADTIRGSVTAVWPTMPPEIRDRDADVWEALLACADAAGGHWPPAARKAAVALVAESKRSTPSLGVALLTDLRLVFGDANVLGTETILKALHELDEAPWGDLRGKPLDARGLARRLRDYEIRSHNVRVDSAQAKGYARTDFADAWSRYLPVEASHPSQPSPDGDQRRSEGQFTRTDAATDKRPGTVRPSHGTDEPPAQTAPDQHGDGWDGWDASTGRRPGNTAGDETGETGGPGGETGDSATDRREASPPAPGGETGTSLTTCACGQPLFLLTPGRTQCERCRLASAS